MESFLDNAYNAGVLFSNGIHTYENLKYRVDTVMERDEINAHVYIYFNKNVFSFWSLKLYSKKIKWPEDYQDRSFETKIDPYRKLFINLLMQNHPEYLI